MLVHGDLRIVRGLETVRIDDALREGESWVGARCWGDKLEIVDGDRGIPVAESRGHLEDDELVAGSHVEGNIVTDGAR